MTIPVRPESTRLAQPGDQPKVVDEGSLFFVVPVHQRHELTAMCLSQLRWTCDVLERRGIRANAVIVGNEAPTLAVAKELGFWTVTQENRPLARKFNDGIEAAHLAGAQYVVPCGSDNWVHPGWFGVMPKPDQVVCHRQAGIVRADGEELTFIEVSYAGGDGIRIFPTELFAPLDYRPAVDQRDRAIDTSIVERLRRFAGWNPRLGWVYHEWNPLEVVGFQSEGYDNQLNQYNDLKDSFGVSSSSAPWEELAQVYPLDEVARMERYFASRARPRRR